MKAKSLIALAAVLMILSLSASAGAYDNQISLTGSYGSTLLGIEYERRLGNFGIGLEASLLESKAYYESGEQFPFRLNGLLRYYLNLSSLVKPYISLAPGALFVFYPAAPEELSYNVAFNMHAAAGIELTPGSLRFAVEAGYEFITVFLYPTPVTEGWFFLKGGAGFRF